jgi:hypothetical protein
MHHSDLMPAPREPCRDVKDVFVQPAIVGEPVNNRKAAHAWSIQLLERLTG